MNVRASSICVAMTAWVGGPLVLGQSVAPPVRPPESGERRVFVRPKVPVSLFTHQQTALLEPECERIATFLARYAAEKYTEGVLRGDPEALGRGRLLLTVSRHLQAQNASAVHCATRWMDGKAPTLPPPGEDVGVFASFLLTAAQRQSDKATPAREALARILTRIAADLAPQNEDAVYASEAQDLAGKAPPLRELLDGTLGRDWDQ